MLKRCVGRGFSPCTENHTQSSGDLWEEKFGFTHKYDEYLSTKIHFKTHDYQWKQKRETTQIQNPEPRPHKVEERFKQGDYPRESLENIEDLLLCDRLVGGLWVGFRCRSEDGVNVDINEGKQLRVQRGGGFTELPIDPVLWENTPWHEQLYLVCKYSPSE